MRRAARRGPCTRAARGARPPRARSSRIRRACDRRAATGCSSARAVLRAVHDRPGVARREQRVIRRGRDVRPMRLHVRQVQHPRRFALRARSTASATVGHVRGLRMLLAHARRQMHVAHVPAGHDACRRPPSRSRSRSTGRRSRSRARADSRRSPTPARAAGGRRSGRSIAKPPSRISAPRSESVSMPKRASASLSRQHVRLAGERRRAPGRAQVVAERVLGGGQRHAIPRRAVRAHVAAGVERHPRRAAHARLHERVVEAHAARRERVEMRRGTRPP